jgi:hypothetical protein
VFLRKRRPLRGWEPGNGNSGWSRERRLPRFAEILQSDNLEGTQYLSIKKWRALQWQHLCCANFSCHLCGCHSGSQPRHRQRPNRDANSPARRPHSQPSTRSGRYVCLAKSCWSQSFESRSNTRYYRDAELHSRHGSPSVLRSEMLWPRSSRGCA